MMSGTLLCAISVDRYINVVSKKHYKRIVTKKSLLVAVAFMILISLSWPIFERLAQNEADIKRIVKGYTVFCGYFSVSTVLGVAFNVSLLRYVRRQRKIYLDINLWIHI